MFTNDAPWLVPKFISANRGQNLNTFLLRNNTPNLNEIWNWDKLFSTLKKILIPEEPMFPIIP